MTTFLFREHDLAAVRLLIVKYDKIGTSRPLDNSQTASLAALIRREASLVAAIEKAKAAKSRLSESNARKRRRLSAATAARMPAAPPPIDWQAVRAEQAAKPASDRWPYTMPALVERVWQSRAPTWVASASSIA